MFHSHLCGKNGFWMLFLHFKTCKLEIFEPGLHTFESPKIGKISSLFVNGGRWRKHMAHHVHRIIVIYAGLSIYFKNTARIHSLQPSLCLNADSGLWLYSRNE